MFLYLSKILPIFLYPLGMVTVLMIIAMIALWKRPRLAAASIALALAILLLSSSTLVTNWLLRSLEWQNIPLGELPKAEAIVVLGGATKPQFPPRPWIDVSEEGDRILHGAQLYKQGKAPWLVMSGGRISWQGGGPAESTDMAEIAKAMGVPASAILQDPTSLNTYENAVNVRQVLNPKGIRRILLVTSAMHMPRSRLIFQRQGFEVIPAPTDFQITDNPPEESPPSLQAALLNALPDAERLRLTTRAIKEYIGIVIYRLRGWL